MRLDIVNHTSHADAPIQEMYDLVGVQLLHLCNRWPGAHAVVTDLEAQGFYIELVDDVPEAPGALGYHDIDKDGNPFSRVAVNPSLQNGSDWLTGDYSVVGTIGHEALETVGNPLVNRWIDIDQTTETAEEMCDAVEDSHYRHRGGDLTNFLTPAWFNPFGKAPFDYLGVLTAPFTMTPGGYMIVRSGGTESQQTAHAAQVVVGAAMPVWRQAMARSRAGLLGVPAVT